MNFSEYIRKYSWATFQGKIRLSFFLLLLMFLVLILTLSFRINSSLKENQYFGNVISPIKIQSERLLSSLNRSNAALNRYAIQFSIEDYRKAVDYLGKGGVSNQLNTAKTAIDSLNSISNRVRIDSEGDLIRIFIQDIQDGYSKLVDDYDLLSAFEDSDKRGLIIGSIPKDLRALNSRVDDLLQTIANIEERKKSSIIWEVEMMIGSDLQVAFFSLLLFFILLIMAIFIASIIIRDYLNKIDLIEEYTSGLAKGNILPEVVSATDEVKPILKNLYVLNKELKNVKKFAEEVGKEKFDTDVDVFHHTGELGDALESMRGSLREIHDREELRKWQLNGINTLAEVIRKSSRGINEFCDIFLHSLIDYSNLNQGAIYLFDAKKKKLVMQACFAYGRKKFLSQEIEIGHGITGEVFRDGDSVVMTDIPQDYVRIHTGLGDAKPTSVAIIPLIYQEEKLGVMELATFHTFTDTEIELFERISEIFTSNLLNAINTSKTEALLKEATENAHKLNAQEEELRQNTEELLSIREGLERKMQVVEDELEIFKALARNSHIPTVQTDFEGKFLGSSSAFVRLLKDVEGDVETTNIFSIIPSLKEVYNSSEPIIPANYIQSHKLLLKNGKAMEVRLALNRAKVHGKTRFSISILNHVD